MSNVGSNIEIFSRAKLSTSNMNLPGEAGVVVLVSSANTFFTGIFLMAFMRLIAFFFWVFIQRKLIWNWERNLNPNYKKKTTRFVFVFHSNSFSLFSALSSKTQLTQSSKNTDDDEFSYTQKFKIVQSLFCRWYI